MVLDCAHEVVLTHTQHTICIRGARDAGVLRKARPVREWCTVGCDVFFRCPRARRGSAYESLAQPASEAPATQACSAKQGRGGNGVLGSLDIRCQEGAPLTGCWTRAIWPNVRKSKAIRPNVHGRNLAPSTKHMALPWRNLNSKGVHTFFVSLLSP